MISKRQAKQGWKIRGCGIALLAGIGPSFAEPQVLVEESPHEVKGVTFEQQLNAQIPLDLKFRDSEGKMVTLKDYFGDKPVVLSLVYYECPMLCTLLLDGYVKCLNDDKSFDIGKEFVSLTVSIDHEETHVLAAGKKASYLGAYKRENDGKDWHFLVGEKDAVKALADAVGFQFKFVPDTGEFAHRSGIVVLTPEGKVSRYFAGVEYDPQHLRMGLIEASDNKIGTLVDRLFLLCYHYDPALGAYGLVISRVINFACVLTVILLLTSITLFLRTERRHRRVQNLVEAGA